jgi:putative ABC transport system permease protein
MLSLNMGRLFTNFSVDYAQEDADFTTDQPVQNIPELEEKYDLLLEEGKTVDYNITGDKVLRIFSENTSVNIPAVLKGKPLSGKDILLDPAYAKANKKNIGDSIEIYGKSFRIAGYMSLPNYIYPLKSDGDIMSDPNTFGLAVISKDDFAALGQGNTFYQVRFKDRSHSLDTQITKLKEYLLGKNINILNWVNTSTNPRVTLVTTKMKGINKVSTSIFTNDYFISRKGRYICT